MTASDDDAYAELQFHIDEFNADLAPHVQRHGWDVGFLLPDPVTGSPPRISLETASGDQDLELAEPTGCAYGLFARPAVLEQRELFDGAGEVTDAPWHLIEMIWRLGRYRYLGAVITSPPLTLPGRPVPAGALAIGADGESLSVETPTGPDRWLLIPGFGYQVTFERDNRAWLVSEMRDAQDDITDILGDSPPG